MKRGEVWTVAGEGYAGKPRPVVIIQSDQFDATKSITVALITSTEIDAPLFRIQVKPGDSGLERTSYVMADKVMTVRRDQLGQRMGELPSEDMLRIGLSLLTFLGIAG